MPISEEALNHWIENFYGYGSWHAPVWFIAYEEGGGDKPKEVADKLNYFYRTHAPGSSQFLCDIRELYRNVEFHLDGPRAHLFSNLNDYRFGDHAVLHGTWKNLIAFASGLANSPTPDLLTYQQNSFAQTSKSNEAILRLFPLPAHNHAWYYAWLDMPRLKFLESREAYEIHVFHNRMQTILEQINHYKPQLVLMYGMNKIERLKKVVRHFYPQSSFSMVKAVKNITPQYHIARLNKSMMVITTQIPALRHNRIETGFDWHTLGKSLALL